MKDSREDNRGSIEIHRRELMKDSREDSRDNDSSKNNTGVTINSREDSRDNDSSKNNTGVTIIDFYLL